MLRGRARGARPGVPCPRVRLARRARLRAGRPAVRHGRRGATVTTDLHVGLTTVAASLDYRVRVAASPGAETARGVVEVTDADLVIRDRTVSRERARVPLETILAVSSAPGGGRADAWAGLAFDGRRDPVSPPALDGDLVVAHATPAGLGRVSLANRPGMLSPRARPDHFAILARWLGLAAAAAAERAGSASGRSSTPTSSGSRTRPRPHHRSRSRSRRRPRRVPRRWSTRSGCSRSFEPPASCRTPSTTPSGARSWGGSE